jgi:ABC-2 type transport system ATP-binding protein
VSSPQQADSVITATDLVKNFGPIEAVKGIDLDVRRGEIFGFLGPNGAGKSTTINILCTLMLPTAGRATVAGYDVASHPGEVRTAIGLVFQDPSLDVQLTARENLQFHAFIYGVPASERAPRIAKVLEMVELSDRANSVVMTFSGGMKRAGSRSRGACSTPRRCSSSTSRPSAWTPRPGATSGPTCAACGPMRASPSS